MHTKEVITAGNNLKEAKKALILLHGRGGNAQDILGLTAHLKVEDFALLAPQASKQTWYPQSFLAPPVQNEPWLTAAIDLLEDLVNNITAQDIDTDNIYFAGFSQGACLALEFVTRTATKLGGVAAFTGGLIGDRIYGKNYSGDFMGTPVFLGTGDPDPHVPLERVLKTKEVLEAMNAEVSLEVYPNRAHSISMDEIEKANTHIFK